MSKYFIDGLRETEEDGIFSVDDDEAEFWTVYRRDHDGFGMAMFDLCIKEEAEKLVQVLEERDALLLEMEQLKNIANGGAYIMRKALMKYEFGIGMTDQAEHFIRDVKNLKTNVSNEALATFKAHVAADALDSFATYLHMVAKMNDESISATNAERARRRAIELRAEAQQE